MTGTGRLFRRGKIWWVDFSYRGVRHRMSSGSPIKADAQAMLREKMSEISRGRLRGSREERVSFDDLEALILRDYRLKERKSLDRLEDSLIHLRGFFGLQMAVDITTHRIEGYIASREDADAAPATVQKECAALKRMLRLAAHSGWLTIVPHVPVPQPRNTRTNFLDGEQLEGVILALPDYLRPVVRFASITGWRKREITRLEWSAVDRQAHTIRLEPGSTKNDEGREVPYGVLPELVALIEAQREYTERVQREQERIIPFVFHRRGNALRDFRHAWQKACVRAGVADQWFHDLRRTAVRNFERAGVPRSVAMKITGHKTEAVYRRYAIADQKSLEEGLVKLAHFRAAQYRHNQVGA